MAEDWSRSKLLQGARNPAAPAGLRQTSERLATGQQRYEQGQTHLQPWMPQTSMLETAKSWYTGANTEGTQNGWDTTFYRNAFNQYDQYQKQAMESGKGSTFFGWLDPNVNKQATGVATWGADPNDQAAKDAGQMRFGDVFNNGVKVANLYDDYDKATADVMVGEFLFSNDEKKQMWAKPTLGPDGMPQMGPEYGAAVEGRRKENTDRALFSKSAESFNDNVQARELALREGKGDEGVILGGVAGGALTGAGVGAAATAWLGPGALVGGIVGGAIGAVAGGVGSYLNQDQMVEMTARAQEKADIANKDLGANWLQRSTMQLGEYSQLGMKFISPVSNLWQGSYDALSKPGANVGDMSNEFYAVNPDGTRKASLFIRGGDIAATVVDSVAQFASPVGQWTYMGMMSGTVAGGVAEMTTGTVFNDRRGQYDELEGWQEWVPAIGSTAIDAAQVGVAGGFAKAARSSRALFTGERTAAGVGARSGRYAPDAATTIDKAVTKVLGGEAAQAGVATSAVNAAGLRFVTGKGGEVLSVRPTLEMIAPSEFLRWVPVGYTARKLARIDGGAMSRDHLLRAATQMTTNSRFRNAVLLGYTEGGEEAVQAWLDPQRTGDNAKLGEVFEAFLYGAASGAGMALGPNNKGASTKQQTEAQAFFQHSRRTGRVPSDQEWSAMTAGWKPKDFEKLARTTATENQETQAVLSTIADLQRQDSANDSSIGFARMEQMKESRSEQLHKKALTEGNGSLVLKGQSSEFLTTSRGTVEKNKFAANAGVMTARETMTQLDNIAKGHQAQLDKTNEELASLGNAMDDHTNTLRAEMTARKDDLAVQVNVSRQVADFMMEKYRRFAADEDPDHREAYITDMNKALKEAYTGTWSGGGLPKDAETRKRIQRAVELKIGRHPFQDRGSFAVVVPQISAELTKLNAHSEIYVQQGMLKAMGGDHDGDTVVPLHTVYESDDSLARLRRGDQYMQQVEDPETKKSSVKVIISAPDGEWAFLRAFKEAMQDSTSWSAQTVTTRMDGLVNDIKAEFSDTASGPLRASELDVLLAKFKDSVIAGREDARMNLVTDMVNLDYEGMRNHANVDGVSNVQWLWSKISETWDITQKNLAHVRSTQRTRPTIAPQREAQETTIRSTIARANAATASATLGLLTSDAVRGAQHLHYSNLYRGLTQISPDSTMTTQQQMDLTRLFMELSSEQTQRDIALVTGRNAVTERVYHWLGMMANSVVDTTKTTPETLLLLANMAVPTIDMVAPNEYQVIEGQTTMLQLLLSRSLDIERAQNRAAQPDSDEMNKIRRLERLTKRDPDRRKHSTTASLAMIEVMGDRPLYELVGSASSYISPQITLKQMIEQQRGLHPRVRNAEIHLLTRSPAYIKDKNRTFGDPPWPQSVLTDTNPPINAFAMLVDAVKTDGDTYVARLKERDATVQKNFVNGLAGLHKELKAYRKRHDQRLSAEGHTDTVEVLRDMLVNDQALASDIANLIPDAAALGVFQVHGDTGRVTASTWLEKMLSMGDSPAELEKAAATYYLQIKLAEFIQMSGTVDQKAISKLEDGDLDKDALVDLDDIRGKIDPTKLKSRFLQVLFHLASQSDHIELSRFLTTMHNAASVDQMFEQINNEPMWRNDQAELLPWHDDVSDFEVDPADVWSTQMDGALQRENIRGWGQRMQIRGNVAVEAAVNFEAKKTTLHGMDQWIRTRDTDHKVDVDGGAMNVGLLKRAIQNRRQFPDYQGQVARQQLVELQQMGLAAVQNKGAPDEKAAPYGEPLITLDSFGWSDGLRQELASLTAEDVEDVMTNLTLLTDGPVRIMLEDGSLLTFDITDEVKALAMLMDPRTQGLAESILFPTVRDVNTSNVVQTYLDTDAKSANDSHGVLSTMLKEQTFTHLFRSTSNFGERVKQAHRYIGNIEAYVRKQAVGSTDQAELDKAYMPVQQMVHEFITAYMHSKDIEEQNLESTRDRLFVDIADAIKAVASVSPDARGELREAITAVMVERFLGDSSQVEGLHESDSVKKSLLELKLLEQRHEAVQKALADFELRIEQAKTQDEKNDITAEQLAFMRERSADGKPTRFPARTYRDAAAALRMFALTGDQNADQVTKAEILTYLGAQDRIHKLERKTVYKIDGVEVNGQSLYHEFLRAYDANPVDPTFAPQEWAVLGSWAAELYLDDITARSSSSVPATGALLGDDGAAVARYFDQSFAYLTDTLFEPKVLEAADVLSQHGTHYEQRDTTDVGNMLTDGLLSDKKIGTWTEVIVNESMKARMILKNSTVGAAVAQEGNDPKVMADYVGGGRVTWALPEESHFSTATLTGAQDQRLGALLTDDLAHAMLENHFVRSVTVQNVDPANQLDPALANATTAVAVVNHTSVEVETSGLRVLDLQKLDDHIEWLKANKTNPLGAYTVTIEYVDVNKKPYEREWANNIFFDGAGREAVGGSGMGAIASLFFGLNALSKVGQQNPLDAATKQGMGFKPHQRTDLLTVENLEPDGARVAEIMAAKAAHMLRKKYPTGDLLRADLPSLFKLQKMRHVITGFNASGRREYMWAEQYIQLEESGADLPLTDTKLVWLSDRVAQTLWGHSGVMGVKGTRGSMTRPTFNIADLDIFPDLSIERLESLGLDRLGLDAELGNTRLAQVNLPPREVATYEKGKTYTSLYKKRLEEWQGQAQKVNTLRSDYRAKGEGKLDIDRINQVNSQLIIDMLTVERQGPASRRLGIPNQGVVDWGAMDASYRIASQVSKMMETENSMVWVYKHGANGDLTTGTIGRADIKDNFAGYGGRGAAFGDVVVVDLTDIQASADVDNYKEASDAAAEVLEVLAKRGLIVTLVSTQGQFDLRADVVERLTNGSVGYRPMAESNNFFVPITEDATYNAAQRALASTLLETEQFTTENMALRIVADGISTNLTEATEYLDVKNDKASHTISHTILPYRLTSTGSVGRRIPLAFNQPQRGTGRADQLSKVNAQLGELLKDDAGREYLKALFNAQEGKYPPYRENPNGTIEHGVLPIDDALDRLQWTIEADKWPLDPGETFLWGTIVPFVSGDGSIHLSRVGFSQPDHPEMNDQRDLRYNDQPMKITASRNKLDTNQTLPPPTVVNKVRYDDLGLSVLGTYSPSPLGKSTDETLGLKSGQAPMPSGYHFPDAPIAATGAAGIRVTRMMGSTSVVGKEAGAGTVNNFRDAFMFAGVNFEDDMIDFMFGEDPGRSEEDRNKLWNLAQRALKMWAASPQHQYTAVELSRMLDNRSAIVELEAKFNAIGATISPDTWRPVSLSTSQDTKQTPLNRLGTIMLATLAAPGVRLEHVISTPGLSTVSDHHSKLLVRRMPALLTDALNDAAHPELRQLLIDRLNRNMPVDDNDMPYYWFDNQLKFHARMTQDTKGGSREEEVVGFLQVHVPVPADENSIRLAYAGVDSSGPESKHIADTIAEATGGRLSTKARKRKLAAVPDVVEELYGKNKIERFTNPDTSAAAFLHLMTRLRVDAPAYTPWMRTTPMEEEHLNRTQAKVRQYTYQAKRIPENGWSPSEQTDGDRLAMSFLSKLNINDEKATAEVEYLVRQLFGIPGPAQDQDDYHEHLTFEAFQSGIAYMERNLKNGLHPLEGGKVPLEHLAFWKMVFDAQKGVPKKKKWLPLMNGNKVKEYAQPDDWGSWVNALHGQMRASHEAFDSRFRTDLDGFYRTYQGAHPDYMEMAMSSDQQIAAKLLHPETNRPYISVDPGYDAVLRDPIVLASRYMTYDALVGRGTVITTEEAEEAAGSIVAKRLKAMEAWQKSESLPKQKDLTMREYARQGAVYQESERKTNNFFRNLINMSVMTRLFNPALYASAMFEVPYRSALEGITNVFTGQMTGRRGKAVAGAAAQLEQSLVKLGAEGTNLTPRYSVEDITRLDALNKSMGESNRFLGLVYGELAYQTVIDGAHGKVGSLLEKGAGAAARVTSDPRWGMKTSSLAKRYNDAAWEYLSMMNSQITIEQYAWEMMNNPGWLEREAPAAHQMGLQAVKQARGAKSTMVGNGIMRPIERMTQSENLFFNGAGHLLKLPFLFTRFNANMLTTMTGLSGLDQMAAMFFDGRQRPQVIKKMMARAKHGTGDEVTPEFWDHTDVIESLDLSRAFVRGAVTQTGLMAAGMMASGLSLGGEDEEERRRKRLATYLNTPFYHDPNKASNDFRWTDAIFLDNIPVLGNIYQNETGHAAVVPHWIFRQFLSPVLGMMRFFETGDALQIGHGFVDAASVLPNSVARLFTEAGLTTQLLMETAADDELIPEKQDKVRQLFMNIVFVYEKALVENAFINALYVGHDEFDRNPWAIAKTNATGEIVREQGTGRPVPTKALQAYQTGEGGTTSNRVGYMTRDGTDALLHQYAEGNATAALIMSIIPWVQGQDTTYLRGNMVTKRQRVKTDETPKEQVEALMFSTYLGRGAQDFVSKEEIIGAIKQREQAAGRYWKQHEVEAEADKIYETMKDRPLTVFDNGGKEVMTLDGKAGVFRSLKDGVIDLDNPAIAGFNISQAERDQIAEEITTELVQEGVDLGLSEQSAMFRMRRIWYGDGTKPGVPGLREILYDKRIPDKPYIEYEQLNVTYVLGPDGKPWATPFSKSNVLQALGIPLPHTMPAPAPGTTYDQRGNVVDLIRGINTGLAAIVPRPPESEIKANDDAIAKAEAKKYTPGGGGYTRRGWRNFGRRGYGRRGYGGGGGGYGGGGGGAPFFQKMMALPQGTSARIDDIQAINVNNPIIRRADVRRERITSERGRLKQWQ